MNVRLGKCGISLTGDQIEPSKFTHNNMIPFFGGNVRQNLDVQRAL